MKPSMLASFVLAELAGLTVSSPINEPTNALVSLALPCTPNLTMCDPGHVSSVFKCSTDGASWYPYLHCGDRCCRYGTHGYPDCYEQCDLNQPPTSDISISARAAAAHEMVKRDNKYNQIKCAPSGNIFGCIAGFCSVIENCLANTECCQTGTGHKCCPQPARPTHLAYVAARTQTADENIMLQTKTTEKHCPTGFHRCVSRAGIKCCKDENPVPPHDAALTTRDVVSVALGRADTAVVTERDIYDADAKCPDGFYNCSRKGRPMCCRAVLPRPPTTSHLAVRDDAVSGSDEHSPDEDKKCPWKYHWCGWNKCCHDSIKRSPASSDLTTRDGPSSDTPIYQVSSNPVTAQSELEFKCCPSGTCVWQCAGGFCSIYYYCKHGTHCVNAKCPHARADDIAPANTPASDPNNSSALVARPSEGVFGMPK